MAHCGDEQSAVTAAQAEVEQKELELCQAQAVLGAAQTELMVCQLEH